MYLVKMISFVTPLGSVTALLNVFAYIEALTCTSQPDSLTQHIHCKFLPCYYCDYI